MRRRLRLILGAAVLTTLHLVVITPEASAGLRHLTITIESVPEGAGRAIIRLETVCADYVVSYETAAVEGVEAPAGRAEPGSDYERTSGTVALTNRSPTEIPVTVFDDELPEPDELVTVTFRGEAIDVAWVVGTGWVCTPAPDSWASHRDFTIFDDDVAPSSASPDRPAAVGPGSSPAPAPPGSAPASATDVAPPAGSGGPDAPITDGPEHGSADADAATTADEDIPAGASIELVGVDAEEAAGAPADTGPPPGLLPVAVAVVALLCAVGATLGWRRRW